MYIINVTSNISIFLQTNKQLIKYTNKFQETYLFKETNELPVYPTYVDGL
jgi:hypothetical protein